MPLGGWWITHIPVHVRIHVHIHVHIYAHTYAYLNIHPQTGVYRHILWHQPKNQPTYKYICIYIYVYTLMILIVFAPHSGQPPSRDPDSVGAFSCSRVADPLKMKKVKKFRDAFCLPAQVLRQFLAKKTHQEDLKFLILGCVTLSIKKMKKPSATRG